MRMCSDVLRLPSQWASHSGEWSLTEMVGCCPIVDITEGTSLLHMSRFVYSYDRASSYLKETPVHRMRPICRGIRAFWAMVFTVIGWCYYEATG
jgi:hypothetical protein